MVCWCVQAMMMLSLGNSNGVLPEVLDSVFRILGNGVFKLWSVEYSVS